MKKTIILLFFSIIICSKSYAQYGDTPSNAQPGKCYAKCMLPQKPSTETANPVQPQWEEVLCGEHVTPQFIQSLRSALIREGSKVKASGEGYDSDLKIELRVYQKNNNLPIGNLNKKTLEALGIWN